MADTQATDLPVLTALASADVLYVVDASDTTDDPEGSSKQITAANLATGLTSIGGLATDAEVTSAISALSTVYQPLDSDLTAIAALTTTSFGRGLLALADAAAARTALGLAIGTDVAAQSSLASYQPLDSDLTAIAALTTTSFGRSLLALADAAASRTALGLGGAATLAVGTTAGTVAAGNDSRLSDARTPTAHASSHADGGSDEIAVDASQIATGTVATARLASGSASASTFLRGDQTWATPAGGGGSVTGGADHLALLNLGVI